MVRCDTASATKENSPIVRRRHCYDKQVLFIHYFQIHNPLFARRQCYYDLVWSFIYTLYIFKTWGGGWGGGGGVVL